MLNLTRKIDETIIISHPDGDITVMVCDQYRGRTVLGVKAPPTVIVRRGELAAWTPKATSA